MEQLKEADEGKELSSTGSRDDIEGLEPCWDLGKLESVGYLTRKANASGSNDVAEDGEHRDAAMLGLNVAEAVEALLVSVIEETKGIPEAEGRLGSKLRFEAHLESRGSSHASHGSKSGSRSQDGKDSSKAEHDLSVWAR